MFSSWLHSRETRPARTATARNRPASRPQRFRPTLQALEDRALPSSYTAGLIADIGLANQAGGANTITLSPGVTFALTAVNNSTYGPTGLPVVAANDTLTIAGNGDTITPSSAPGTPAFHLLAVGSGATLTLTNVTVANGSALGSGVAVEGGIYNLGTLTINGGAVYDNSASGQSPAGGGIYNAGGSVTLQPDTTVTNNQTRFHLGTGGGSGYGGAIYSSGGSVTGQGASITANTIAVNVGVANSLGGSAYGGGVYVVGGTLSLTGSTLSGNTVVGSVGWKPGTPAGNGYGGGVYVAGGTVTLTGDTVQSNGAADGGGGLYIAAAATVYLDAFTLANTTGNSPNNIVGTYILM